MKNEKLIIFAGPSGVGKSTISKHILEKRNNECAFSISATTRKPRPGEINGQHYHFLSVEEFKQKIKENAFAEYEEVYEGIFYGTFVSEIESIFAIGKAVIFDIDVYGALNLKNNYGDNALTIIVTPPTLDDLKKRLTARDSETEESLKKRLDKAEEELSHHGEFDQVIVNADGSVELEKTLAKSLKIVDEFLALKLA
ncbi:MAG: guanylate kinase [Candidatus Paceibacterota bacterium]